MDPRGRVFPLRAQRLRQRIDVPHASKSQYRSAIPETKGKHRRGRDRPHQGHAPWMFLAVNRRSRRSELPLTARW